MSVTQSVPCQAYTPLMEEESAVGTQEPRTQLTLRWYPRLLCFWEPQYGHRIFLRRRRPEPSPAQQTKAAKGVNQGFPPGHQCTSRCLPLVHLVGTPKSQHRWQGFSRRLTRFQGWGRWCCCVERPLGFGYVQEVFGYEYRSTASSLGQLHSWTIQNLSTCRRERDQLYWGSENAWYSQGGVSLVWAVDPGVQHL